ncbi:recombinase family protein [Thiorhodococcus mannitoliphagus]|uniref:Recombinase family protein n=1 Tax=Thiorhodococcus mannitoliphagus TaxID=329406 RepID=A0A6P1DPK3_9GAMM|nr:recombinase family protein [Thiorhodococcus mannitoliphagus]NEX19928.1 recombinase family protein [Thiorhodococcus mannitoliphagus]
MRQKNRAALYLRDSTADQKPDLQFDGLRAYAERAELEIVRDYLDLAASGRRQGRPRLDALMRDARNRAFDCVLVWKFDRFARSTKYLLSALEEFDHLGIRFVSVQYQIDTTSPMGKAMFTLIGAMAELEFSLISERVSAGMHAAKARGKHLGRPRTSARIVTEVEELARTTNLSVGEIQRRLGGKTGRGGVGAIVKRVRHEPAPDTARGPRETQGIAHAPRETL